MTLTHTEEALSMSKWTEVSMKLNRQEQVLITLLHKTNITNVGLRTFVSIQNIEEVEDFISQ